MEPNILEILETKLLEFKQKKQDLENKYSQLKEEKISTEKTIFELQVTQNNLNNVITSTTQEMEHLEKIIEEMEDGYNSLKESGEFLINIINQNSS